MPSPNRSADDAASLTLAVHHGREVKRYLKIASPGAQMDAIEQIVKHLAKIVELMPELGNATVAANRSATLARLAYLDLRSAEEALAECLIAVDQTIEYINIKRRRRI